MKTDKENDLWYWVMKDVTPEVIKQERERMKKEGKLVEHETPFGTLSMLKHDGLEDDQAFTVSPINEDRFKKLVDVAIVGGDRSVRALVVSKRTYNWLMASTPEDVQTKEDLVRFINDRKFTAEQLMVIGSDRQIDEIVIQPEFV